MTKDVQTLERALFMKTYKDTLKTPIFQLSRKTDQPDFRMHSD